MLKSFLEKKTLYYDKIDYDIIANAWQILKSHINLPYVIHIVGTNGKGSTGRYLAHILVENNHKVLHYSSPHILEFNERIWINGQDSSDIELNLTHKKLLTILPNDIVEKLTYFEYTTLLAFVLSDGLDYIVLEAGLGGEFDATNVVPNDLTIITTIGLDHIEFLGDTIKKIATTKMKSCDKVFILGKQVYNDVLMVKEDILKDKKEILLDEAINMPFDTLNLPKYLKENLQTVVCVLKYLELDIVNFRLPTLFGRCFKLTPNITIDVGHNPLAAQVLVNEFYGKKITLIYNSYKDKDYSEVLKILKPIIKEVQIININDQRIVDYSKLKTICDTLSITVKKFDTLTKNINYLVFGSFKVIEEFLKYKDKSNIER